MIYIVMYSNTTAFNLIGDVSFTPPRSGSQKSPNLQNVAVWEGKTVTLKFDTKNQGPKQSPIVHTLEKQSNEHGIEYIVMYTL